MGYPPFDVEELIAPMYEEAKSDEEFCKVIFASPAGKITVASVPNRHEDSKDHFRIVQSDIDSLSNVHGQKLIGVIHTHWRPGDQEPSYDDVKQLPDGLIGVVVHPPSKSWTMYNNKVGVINFKDGRK